MIIIMIYNNDDSKKIYDANDNNIINNNVGERHARLASPRGNRISCYIR